MLTARVGQSTEATRRTAAVASGLRRLEVAVLIFVLYGAVEGLIKRLTGYSVWVYPLKDLFFAAVLMAWLTMPRSASTRSPARGLCAAYFLIAALQMLNPYLPNPVVGI